MAAFFNEVQFVENSFEHYKSVIGWVQGFGCENFGIDFSQVFH